MGLPCPEVQADTDCQPDIVVVDKKQKIVVVLDVAVPSDSNIKEYEKLEKYQGLKEELKTMWKVKAKVVQ